MPISSSSPNVKNVLIATGRKAAGRNRMRVKILANMTASLLDAAILNARKQKLPCQ